MGDFLQGSYAKLFDEHAALAARVEELEETNSKLWSALDLACDEIMANADSGEDTARCSLVVTTLQRMAPRDGDGQEVES